MKLWGSPRTRAAAAKTKAAARAAAGTQKCKKFEKQCVYPNLYEGNDYDHMIALIDSSIENTDEQIQHTDGMLQQLQQLMGGLDRIAPEPTVKTWFRGERPVGDAWF